MNTYEDIRETFISLCEENEVFEVDEICDCLDLDIIDSGLVDSMGLLMVQSLIMEEFNLNIPMELFVAELRTINKVINHIFKMTT